MWDVEYTEPFGAWWDSLAADEQAPIIANVELLAERGPGLGRPAVDTITSSRHANMKELRVGMIRIFFAFDPRRTAVPLIGGSKRGRWQEFYELMVPVADDLYDEHLQELREERSADA